MPRISHCVNHVISKTSIKQQAKLSQGWFTKPEWAPALHRLQWADFPCLLRSHVQDSAEVLHPWLESLSEIYSKEAEGMYT